MLQCIITEDMYAEIPGGALMARSAQGNSESLLKLGVAMICAGTAVCGFGSLMAKPAFQQAGYIAAAFLIAVCLLSALLTSGFGSKNAVSRPMAFGYLAASLLIVCYTAVSAIQSSKWEIPAVGILAGLLGLFWAAWLMTLAFGFQPRTPQAVGLCALAAANSSFSLLIGTRIDAEKLGSVALAGGYLIVLGIQIYLTAILLHREIMRERAFGRS